jgi:hypothetical protein
MLGIAWTKAIQSGGKMHVRSALANAEDNDDTAHGNNQSGSKEHGKSVSANADNLDKAVYGNKAVHNNDAACNDDIARSAVHGTTLLQAEPQLFRHQHN